ncbi:MAG: nucleotidyltransferase domain-containing protein [Clostridia bacterium]|nr:nucleotidyltransferase domain-containing protein [Clostridia bacterium]
MELKELLEQRLISIYKLSKETGIPYATLHDVISKEAHLEKCSAETIYRIAKELGVTMEALLEPIMAERHEFEESLKRASLVVSDKYPQLKRVYLFGSRADGTNRDDSDVDLLLELEGTVTLLTLSGIKIEFEELLGLPVDVVESPLPKDSFLQINRKVKIFEKKRQSSVRKNNK